MDWKKPIDPDLGANLDAAIEGGLIARDSAAADLAQQVICGGVESQSLKQRFIYERVVEPCLAQLAELLRAQGAITSGRD